MEVEKFPQAKKARKRPSKIKTMLITFFDLKEIIHKEFVPSGQTVTAEYCLDVLKNFCILINLNNNITNNYIKYK